VRLLDDLLDISRITCGTIDLRKEPVELFAIIATAVETVQPLIEAAGQRLTITPASQPIWLEADPIRLEQVFANLLNNATKYTGDGGDIRLVVEPLDGAVQIAVGDSGVGIRAELLPHVFELFRRDLAVPGRDKGGLGIGLSLVRRLTELHGGHVEARSAGPGAGSEFCVRLPVLPAPPRRMPDPTLSRHRPTCPLPAGCRILIVDDNQDAADSLGSLLAGQGGQVDIAYDGPAALARVEERRPDVIVLDIGMPGMDGHEVARRIRAHTDLPQPILIALSGLGQHADRQRSRKAGFDYHLVKPVPIDVLESLLAAGWRRRHPGRGTATSAAPGAALEQAAPGPPAGPFDAPREERRAVSPAAVADVAAGQSMPSPGPQMAVRPPALGYEIPAATGDSDRLRPVDSALLHDLAQPLNTIACYAVAARGLAAKSAADPTPLTKALRGIDQQILRAGAALDRLRALLTDLPDADADADTGADPLRRAAADPDECVPGR
jgi:CheY-like chemotaxis protein